MRYADGLVYGAALHCLAGKSGSAMIREGIVTSLFVFQDKGMPGTSVNDCHFIKNLGMEGDRHAHGGDRQVTLLSGEVRRWMEVQTAPGLCFKRYKANIETQGISLENIEPGTRIGIGTAVFEVTECVKTCFPECALFMAGGQCRLSSGGLYLRVAESGTVLKNDKIVIFA